MDVLIEKLNGEKKKFSEIGLTPRDFLVSTAGVRSYSSEISGRSGKIDKGADYGSRTITVPFMFKSEDLLDFPRMRDEIYAWLGGKEAFWIYEGRSLGLIEFEQPGESFGDIELDYGIIFSKRYLVRRTSDLAPDQRGIWGLDSIEFETTELPFAETSETTLTPITGDTHQYTFVNPINIQVYNGGNEPVDPEEDMFLNIEYVGESAGLTIRNQTNGTEWNFNGESNSGDSIIIDGVHSTLNSLSIVRNTNLGLIILEPGWNNIEVSGATNGTLSFDFRWYYR